MTYLSDKVYRFIYNRSVRMCVDMVITNPQGHVFLTRRDIEPYKGLWHFPGGAIRFKEPLADAANRIAQREFGCEVRILKHIGLCETLNDDLTPTDMRHSNSIVVHVELVAGLPKVTEESSDVAYFDTLPPNMHPYHGKFIKDYNLL